MRFAVGVALVVSLAACGGDTTAPSPLTLADMVGHYEMTRVTAGPLPAYLHEQYIDPRVGIQKVSGGSFTIHEDGTADRVEIIQNNTGLFIVYDTLTTHGTVSLAGTVMTFAAGETWEGRIAPDTVTIRETDDAGSRIYTRP